MYGECILTLLLKLFIDLFVIFVSTKIAERHMQILVLLNFGAALQGIFLTYLIAHNKRRDTKSIVLGALTLVLSISLLGGVYGLSGYYKNFPHFTNVADPLFLLYGPLLFIYIFVLTHNRLPKHFFLHGIPFLAYLISFIPFYLQSGEEKIKFAEFVFLNNEVPFKALLMQLARVVYLGIYIVICLWLVKKYERRINDNFSNIEKISLNKAKITLYFFLIALLVSIVSFILGYQLSYSYNISNNIIGLFVGIIIYALAYATWNKKSVDEAELFNATPQGIHRSKNDFGTHEKAKGRSVFVLNDEQLDEYSSRLKNAIEADKVFTENEISLTELSNKISIQPYQLSEVISRVYGESFFDFINRYRIEEIKTRLEDPKSDSYSLLGIAMDCGFNSKSSFNSAFKKFTGVTPSEYRKLKLVDTSS